MASHKRQRLHSCYNLAGKLCLGSRDNLKTQFFGMTRIKAIFFHFSNLTGKIENEKLINIKAIFPFF